MANAAIRGTSQPVANDGMVLTMGMISAGHCAGAFLGGYLFDLTLRYDWVWLSSVALAVSAGLLVLALQDRAAPDVGDGRASVAFIRIRGTR